MGRYVKTGVLVGSLVIVAGYSPLSVADGVSRWFSEDVRLGVGAIYEQSTYTQDGIVYGDVCCATLQAQESDYSWSLGFDVKLFAGLRFFAAGAGGYDGEYTVTDTSQLFLPVDPNSPPPPPAIQTQVYTRSTDSSFEYGLRYEIELAAVTPFISAGQSHHSYSYRYESDTNWGDGRPPTSSTANHSQRESEGTVGVGLLLVDSFELEYKMGLNSDTDFSQLSLMWKF